MTVHVHVPPRGTRSALRFSIEVEREYIVSAPRGAEWMLGWHADVFRKFCLGVGWRATISSGLGRVRVRSKREAPPCETR